MVLVAPSINIKPVNISYTNESMFIYVVGVDQWCEWLPALTSNQSTYHILMEACLFMFRSRPVVRVAPSIYIKPVNISYTNESLFIYVVGVDQWCEWLPALTSSQSTYHILMKACLFML